MAVTPVVDDMKRREYCALFYVFVEKLIEAKQKLAEAYERIDTKERQGQINFWSEERDLWFEKMAELVKSEKVVFKFGKRATFKGGSYKVDEKEEIKEPSQAV